MKDQLNAKVQQLQVEKEEFESKICKKTAIIINKKTDVVVLFYVY